LGSEQEDFRLGGPVIGIVVWRIYSACSFSAARHFSGSAHLFSLRWFVRRKRPRTEAVIATDALASKTDGTALNGLREILMMENPRMRACRTHNDRIPLRR